MKILMLDVETSPNIAHVWGLWNQNISLAQLQESSEMICFAARFYREQPVHFHSVHHDGKDAMVRAAHALMTEADAIITYNGRKFDIPTLNREFLVAGFQPPAPAKQIDLYQVVKRHFRFPSSRLDYVAQTLGIGAKVKHAGHELWVRCMAGDDEAWEEMRRYNVQDVDLLELLYDRLRPWITNHPHHGLYDGADTDVCPNCGSDDLRREGHAYTQLGRYQRFQCRQCGAWSRSNKRTDAQTLRGVVE